MLGARGIWFLAGSLCVFNISAQQLFPEKRVLLVLRSELALQERISKIRHFLLILGIVLRSDLAAQDRILKIRVLASLNEAAPRPSLFRVFFVWNRLESVSCHFCGQGFWSRAREVV